MPSLPLARRTFLSGALAASAALARPSIAHAQTVTTLRVATTPLDTGAQLYYAADMGFFKKAGFDVEVSSITSGSAIAAGVASGSFDFAQVNIVSLAQAFQRNVKFVLAAPGGVITDRSITSGLVVPKASPLSKAKDFNGKTIAVNALASIQQLAVAEWLDKNGADSTTVKFVEMPTPQLIAALIAGRIDMALVPEPELDNVEHGTDTKMIAPAYSSIAPAFLLSAWVTSAQFFHDHPDAVKAFAAVMAETARWGNTHHAESGLILSKYTKIAVTPTMARVQYAETFNPAQMQPVFDSAYKYGLLKTPTAAADVLAR